MFANVDARVNEARTPERHCAAPSSPVIGELLPVEQVVADINSKAREPGIYKTSMAAEAAVLAIGALIHEKSAEEHNKFNALKSEWEARIDERDNEFKQLLAKFEKKDEEKEEVVRKLKQEHFKEIIQINTTHKKTILDLNASFESEKNELIRLTERDFEDTVDRRTKDKTFILTEEIRGLKELVKQLQLEKMKAADESVLCTPTGDDSGFLYRKTRRSLFDGEPGSSSGSSSPEPADFAPATKPEPPKPEPPKPEPPKRHDGPRCIDGSLDMRYAVNRGYDKYND